MRVIQATEPRGIAMGGQAIAILALLVPVFLEGIDDGRFLVPIPGFPLSVGKLALVAAGLLAVLPGWKAYMTSPAAKGVAFVSAGCCIGALFSGDVLANMSRTAGLALLFAAAAGTACLWGLRPFRWALDLYFVMSLVYWLTYVARTFITSGGSSYTQLYIAGQAELENHHVPGLYLSVCAVYVALRFFFRDGRMRIGGFVVFGVALAACLFIESRSNLGFTAIALLLVMLQERRGLGGRLFWAIPLLVVMYTGLGAIFESSEGIQRRFEATSQTQATDSRVALFVAGVDAVLAQPLGRGILNNRVESNGKQWNVHNQYLTFGVAGGFIALVGCLVWLWDYQRILLGARAKRRRPVPEPFRAADAMALLMMYVTLLTLEFTGMLFFLVLSLGVYRSGVSAAERRQKRIDLARRRRAQSRASGPSPDLTSTSTAVVHREAYS